ncbi:hypothetical protein G7046_g5216 [Stylonectria norvegica]|nr:hypothetical protein G7046_g5216 [Stylonectria norvegica]
MPSYLYHLTFELYPTQDPIADESPKASNDSNFWLPRSDASVFDDFPSHPPPDRQTSYRVPTSYTSRQTPIAPEQSSLAGGQASPNPNVIDCGAPRAPVRETERNIEIVTERQWIERVESALLPSSSAAIRPQTAIRDWRFGRVSIETVDLRTGDQMAGETSRAGAAAAPTLGPMFGGSGTATKAKYSPLETKNTELGWGVVHFYREGDETPALESTEHHVDGEEVAEDGDYTTLCIPAVPMYMSPGDFWGFVGEKWRRDIAHCRMVMTSKMNRYLVLLKFRDSQAAKEWRHEFDGKVFNDMEPQTCHVVFVKSITFETPTRRPSQSASAISTSAGVSTSLRPFPPPTPSLVELPTCPVCLERMDDTNGLMTIPCSHVFHCTCLQSWKGAGCPVCRFTNTSQATSSDPNNPYTQPFGSSVSNLCTVCDSADDLWICLICGYVGCGRYKGGHAKDHWKETAHSFSLELETQHVWDYAGDMWVHRLIRDKGDGKVVELPGRGTNNNNQEEQDVVPRAKLESIGLEYTHLITSQLESQRAYYEELINQTVGKASAATKAAELASEQTAASMKRLSLLEDKCKTLQEDTIPQLERDLHREQTKASRSEGLARNLAAQLREEHEINEGLLKRIAHVNADHEGIVTQLAELKGENVELKEMNRDLSMFISGQEKLKEMESAGQLEEGEIEGGSASVPIPERKGKGKRRGKK